MLKIYLCHHNNKLQYFAITIISYNIIKKRTLLLKLAIIFHNIVLLYLIK